MKTRHADGTGEEVAIDRANANTPDLVMESDGTPAVFAHLLAVESTDFLGDVFLCQDAATGDILRARMYTPVAELVDWIEAHPSVYDSCQLIIRYSPYNNYADYITSLANGVRLGITQGGGYGRVIDATLFVPGQ